MAESTVRDRLIAAIRKATDDGASKTEDVADTILESGAWPPAPEDALEQATWALIEYDTDTADRGVSDEHYRERRADVERVAPILAVRGVEMTPENELKARQLFSALTHIYLDREIGDRAREITQNFPTPSEFDVPARPLVEEPSAGDVRATAKRIYPYRRTIIADPECGDEAARIRATLGAQHDWDTAIFSTSPTSLQRELATDDD